MAVRIIAGALRGRKLRSVRGRLTRPTANRAREAVFNILALRVRDARVLDLFAGTGAFGIEALSRGAAFAAFVDIHRDAIEILQTNIKNLGLDNRSKIIRSDPTRSLDFLAALQRTFNLVFMDPPYNQGMIRPALARLHRSQTLAQDAWVVVEHSLQEAVAVDQMPFRITDQRKYGKTLVSILDYML
jgi:16S rRNA (guanine966-N2)-methyltransferase